jgi:hypothetical protein
VQHCAPTSLVRWRLLLHACTCACVCVCARAQAPADVRASLLLSPLLCAHISLYVLQQACMYICIHVCALVLDSPCRRFPHIRLRASLYI